MYIANPSKIRVSSSSLESICLVWQNFFSCGWVSSLDAGGDDGPSPSLSEEANFPANSDYEGEGDHQFPGKTGTVRTWKMMKTKGHAGENCAV